MFFLSLLIFLPCAGFLPWWSLSLGAFFLGGLRPSHALSVSGAAGISWAALAFIFDGRSHGLISQRMSGLFNLPWPWMIFLGMFMIAALTALLSYKVAEFLHQLTAQMMSKNR